MTVRARVRRRIAKVADRLAEPLLAGFTLLEVLVAMMILSGGLMVIAVSWGGNSNRLAKARLNNALSVLLQRSMVEIEAKYRDRIGDLPEELGEAFEDFPEYSWQMKSRPLELPDMSGALAAREGGANELLITMSRMISQYVKDAVKEVTVTVAYRPKGASRDIKASATTYFIDYTKEPSMGGAGLPAGGAAGGSGGGGGAGR